MKIAVFVAQDPLQDPRVDWCASYAAREHDVSVIGIALPGSARPLMEVRNGYRILRQPLRAGKREFLDFLRMLSRSTPPATRIGYWIVGVLLLPFVLAILATVRVRPRTQAGEAPRNAPFSILSWTPMWLRMRRLRALVHLLYTHFAPVASAFWTETSRQVDKPDIAHCCDLDTLLVGVRLKSEFGCRIVYDTHEYWPYSDPDFSWIERAVFAQLERLLIAQADTVITVNDVLAERIAADYRLASVVSIPNAVPLNSGRRPTGCSGEITRLAAGRIKFLYQGGFAPHRGIEELLRAWQHVDTERAALFLRGPESMSREDNRQLAKEFGLLDRSVYFMEPVSEDELVTAASEADIGLITYLPTILNHVCCCPNKLSQYMHANLMILADSNLRYVARVVEAAGAGVLYDSRMPMDLERAIGHVVDHPEEVRSCKENAGRYALHEFNWDVVFRTLRPIYRNTNSRLKPGLAA